MLKTTNNRLFFPSIFLFALLFSCTVLAGEATDRIKATTDKLIEIVTNHELDPPEMENKRYHMIKEAVDMVFDWEAFSQRAIGKHWRKLNREERKEFIFLFGRLIERTYMDKTRKYSGEQIRFVNEKTDKKYGTVEAIVTTKYGMEVEVRYSVIKKNGSWFVYDLHVEGISLGFIYRVQFNSIMITSSYNGLLKRLKTKIDEG
ncbi:phospholipid-binding protein MlaC [Thermodesulfobacteriota bacterium]